MAKARFTAGVALTLALALSSCSGVLMEKRLDDGQAERVRLQTEDKWSTSPSRDPTHKEGTVLFLKKESTF
jgi:hypothetical protein